MKKTIKEELLEFNKKHQKYGVTAECALLTYEEKKFILPYGWDSADDFLNQLDFIEEYDGLQGTIWLTDGTWVERMHSDNSDPYWHLFECPKIPDECLTNKERK